MPGSPLLVDRPAAPGGRAYWGRIARLAPLERVLVEMDDQADVCDVYRGPHPILSAGDRGSACRMTVVKPIVSRGDVHNSHQCGGAAQPRKSLATKP